MSINGASRTIQADNQLKKEGYSALNANFKNENDKVKSTKKFPLKASASEHNHSK